MVAQAKFVNPKRIGNWVLVCLVLYLLSVAFAFWSGLQRLDLMDRIVRDQFSPGEALASETRQLVANFAQLVLLVITSVFFLRWTYVVARNARALGAQELSITPGWAVGYYFIPVLSLWKPYQAIRETWQASRNPAKWRSEKNSMVVRLWWVLWLLFCLIGLAVLGASMTASYREDLIKAARYYVVWEGISVLLCVAMILLVQRLSSQQAAKFKDVV